MKRNRFLDFIERITIDPRTGMGLINDIAYEKTMSNQPAWKTVLLWLIPERCFNVYFWMMEHTICKRLGHDWIDDSYGGPDSGCMAGHCERCGHSFRHNLY